MSTTASSTPALWKPSAQRRARSAMTRFIQMIGQQSDPGVVDYPSLHLFSINQPELFWESIWEFTGVVSSRRADRVVDNIQQMPGAEWFEGSRLNMAENLLQGEPGQLALVFCGEDGSRRSLTYAELTDQTARLSHHLRALGVQVGDRVAGYLPNGPEAVIAMLATSSIGAIWSSCSPDFGVNGVIDRFGQIEPRVLFAVNGYHYGGKIFAMKDRIEQIRAALPNLTQLIVHEMVPQAKAAMPDDSVPFAECISPLISAEPDYAQLPFDHPLYILYSSGTTGVPKCIVHGAGGTLLQHNKELVLHTDVGPDDTVFYFTTCGWMMWNWLISSLSTGATVVLFDGNPFHPSPTTLIDLIDELGITVFGTSAKYLSALQQATIRPARSHSLETLKTILSTGSPLLPEQFDYVYQEVKSDVLLASISGGTDIISCFALGNPLLPVYAGQLQCLGLGMAVEILDDDNQSVVDETGELSCARAFPSMPVYFWNDPDGSRYLDAYFRRMPSRWCHGDYARITPEGGLIIYGRSDATLNPGGVRIGTAEIYRQVEQLDEVIESIAIGQQWQGDERIVLFVSLIPEATLDEALIQRIRQQIRANTTPRHVPAKIIAVTDIPRTISGKIVELAVRQIVHGQSFENSDALANPEALEQFRNVPELAGN